MCNAGLSEEQIYKRDAAKEAGSRAVALEMVCDLERRFSLKY